MHQNIGVGRISNIFIFAAIVVFFAVHLYRITAPPNGYHKWRESDTAAVALNYVQDDLSFFTPRTNQIDASTPMAKMELPAYCYLTSLGYKIFGYNHLIPRLLTLLFGCMTIWLTARIVTILSDRLTGAFSAWATAFSPLFFFYSYKIMPDIMMLALLLLSFYFFLRFVNSRNYLFWVASALPLAIAICIKPFGLFLYLPLIYVMRKKGIGWKSISVLIPIHILIAIIPAVAWMNHSGWLLDRSAHAFAFMQYFISVAFFKRIFLQWPPELWIGWIMLPAFLYGTYHLIKNKKGGPYLIWILAVIAVLAIMARYSREHDYYSLIMIPPLAAIAAAGLRQLYENSRWQRSLLYLLIVLAPFGAFARIHSRFSDSSDFYAIRQAVDKVISENSRVLVKDFSRGAIMLYQLNRKGWHIDPARGRNDIIAKINRGAEFLILDQPLEKYDNSLKDIFKINPERIGPLYCYSVKRAEIKSMDQRRP